MVKPGDFHVGRQKLTLHRRIASADFCNPVARQIKKPSVQLNPDKRQP
jgi:hypothetical protein